MKDSTNRYRTPAKRAAYEYALHIAHTTGDICQLLLHVKIANRLNPDLSHEVRKQVAAKAIRVERGRRRKHKKS